MPLNWGDLESPFNKEEIYKKNYFSDKIDSEEFFKKIDINSTYKEVSKIYKSINNVHKYINKIQYSFTPKINIDPLFAPQTQEQLAALLNLDSDHLRNVVRDLCIKGLAEDVVWFTFDFETLGVAAIEFLKHYDVDNNRFPIVVVKVANENLHRSKYLTDCFIDSRHSVRSGYSWIILLSDEITNMCKLAGNIKMNLAIEMNILMALNIKYEKTFSLKKIFFKTNETQRSLDACLKLLASYCSELGLIQTMQ